MLNEWIESKIRDSKEILKLAVEISQEYYQKPLIITYSGGKDSDVMLQLALECLKPNQFEVLNSHTTVDAPETVYHIREKFEELERTGIKATIKYPRYKDGRYKSMWSLIEDRMMPPTRLTRYCCKELKETSAPNRFVALGIRKAESAGRKGRDVFATRGRSKAEAYFYDRSHIKEVFETAKQKTIEGGQSPNDDNVWDCTFISKAKHNEDLICNPIYEWTDHEVWMFIRDRKIKYNPLYDRGYARVGCVGCPLAGNQVSELEKNPKYKLNYIRAFDRMLKKRKVAGKDDVTGKSGLHCWKDGETVYKWWINDTSIEGQTNIYDFVDGQTGEIIEHHE